MSSSGAIYRGRLAPSPTGDLHLGVARTALCAWLRARAAHGALVLRIEDIDTPRVVPGSAESIMQDLRWLGLDWDEGPDVGGPHAPYLQSQRTQHYLEALSQLRAQGLLYPCTCTRKEIASAAVASAPHGDLGPLYPGTCRNGSARRDRPAALRFKYVHAAAEGHTSSAPTFTDLLCGPYRDGVVDDFILRRGDGLFAYQLAVVVDDIAMGITEVVRGADLLSSTPRQLALYQALGATPPAFVHVPLLLGSDGARLAKRDKSTHVGELRSHGVSPETIIGALAASLGLVEHGRALPAAELVEGFDLTRLPLTAARMDHVQLTESKPR